MTSINSQDPSPCLETCWEKFTGCVIRCLPCCSTKVEQITTDFNDIIATATPQAAPPTPQIQREATSRRSSIADEIGSAAAENAADQIQVNFFEQELIAAELPSQVADEENAPAPLQDNHPVIHSIASEAIVAAADIRSPVEATPGSVNTHSVPVSSPSMSLMSPSSPASPLATASIRKLNIRMVIAEDSLTILPILILKLSQIIDVSLLIVVIDLLCN